MVKRLAVVGDLGSGHASLEGPYPPHNLVTTKAPFVFIEGKPVLTTGDIGVVHANVPPPGVPPTPHPGSIVGGSSRIFIDGVPVVREGDRLAPPCGGSVIAIHNTFVFEE